MPCYDGRDAACSQSINKDLQELQARNDRLKDRNDRLKDRNDRLKDRNDLLARLLCYLMNSLGDEAEECVVSNNNELKTWWIEHKKFDEERLKNAPNNKTES